ncbi:intraflagellar transport protein 22 homolog isoform X1 [Xenia sp. Carnegie-2017]|uniref:intraflagellar transport protein 22 homolog isoform X1 n=1 Tax=Xenia sp. Carnegie-2017 TaxID=2897299 RepID=UPI001F046B25|nr:intraflagellar transport protein 22 homolog isoform X1 [Xenia sp. Carnegie-2017]
MEGSIKMKAEGSLNDVAQARKLRQLPRSERVVLSKKSNEPLTKKNENKKRQQNTEKAAKITSNTGVRHNGNSYAKENKATRQRGKREILPNVGMFKAKILVIGPTESGKTVISNYLADATEISGGEYNPTQGVRILEFECSGISLGKKDATCEVELWDCSGDPKFENCWPAIQKDAIGILFVYNPDQMGHGKQLETLYVHFVQEQGLKDTQCMVFAHHKPGANDKTRSHIPSYLSNIPCVQTNLESDSDFVKEKFNDLLAILMRNWTDKRDQEELSIMNN